MNVTAQLICSVLPSDGSETVLRHFLGLLTCTNQASHYSKFSRIKRWFAQNVRMQKLVMISVSAMDPSLLAIQSTLLCMLFMCEGVVRVSSLNISQIFCVKIQMRAFDLT